MRDFIFGMICAACIGTTYFFISIFSFIHADSKYVGNSIVTYLESKYEVDKDCDNIQSNPNVEIVQSATLRSTQKTLRELIAGGKLGTILLFWTNWCPHCKDQIIALNNFHNKNPNIKCINIVSGQNVTTEEIANLLRKISKRNIEFIFDRNKECFREFYRDQGYKVQVPMFVFLSPNGTVLVKVKGKIKWNETGQVISKCSFEKSIK